MANALQLQVRVTEDPGNPGTYRAETTALGWDLSANGASREAAVTALLALAPVADFTVAGYDLQVVPT